MRAGEGEDEKWGDSATRQGKDFFTRSFPFLSSFSGKRVEEGIGSGGSQFSFLPWTKGRGKKSVNASFPFSSSPALPRGLEYLSREESGVNFTNY